MSETGSRPDWNQYFIGIAQAVAARAECTRRQVGAVIVKDRRILATGYNGAPAGKPSCLHGACPRGLLSAADMPEYSSYDTGPGQCIALHAEMNAVAAAARYGGSVQGASLYVTHAPCNGCMKLIEAVQFNAVCWPDKELELGLAFLTLNKD